MEDQLSEERLARLKLRLTTRKPGVAKLDKDAKDAIVTAFLDTTEPITHIARRFKVSGGTVRYHISRYLKRCGVRFGALGGERP